MLYTVKLYDCDLNLLRVLPTVPYLRIQRSPNAGARISLNCPYIEEGISDLQIAANVAVYRNEVKICDGRITARDLSRREASFDALGHEDRFGKMRTPQSWAGWNGFDLADMARDVVNRFRFKRFTTKADWQSAHASNDVNLTVEPGSVMLGLVPHASGERFVEHGWIQFRVDLGDQAFPTGRIARWSERAGEPTRITIQSRAASSPVDLDSAPWGPELTAVHVDSVRENEVSGVPLADGGPWVDIRVHLYTTDTTSPDNQTEPHYYGRTPILDGLEVIWREPTEIQVGDIPATTGITIQDGTWNRVNHLKALKDECDRAGWQFRVRHDEETGKIVLDLAETFGRDLSGAVILRQQDNALITTLSDSDSEYANVLNCWGKGSGVDRLYIQLRNEAAILDRGGEEVEADFEVDTDDPDELLSKGEAELARRSTIVPQFVVTVLDTNLDLQLGDTVKVGDPRSGLLVDSTITEEYRECSASREEVRVALGGASLANAIEQLIAAQRRTPRATVPARPDSPANITVQGLPGVVRFWWAGRADAFEIEHTSQEENGSPVAWSSLATVTERFYQHSGLTLGSRHWYRIRAVVDGRTSDWVVFDALAKDTVPPGTPTQFSMYGTIEGIGVQFTPPADDDLAYVEVHLSKNPDFTPSTEGEPGDWDGEEYTLYDRLAAPTNVGRYDFPAGEALYGRLVAVDDSGNRSTPTNELSATSQVGIDLSPPTIPMGLTAQHVIRRDVEGQVINEVHLAWLPNADANIGEYVVWRRSNTESSRPIATVAHPGTDWVDAVGLAEGVTYYYWLRAISVTGVPSDPTLEVPVLIVADPTIPPLPDTPPTINVGNKLLSVIMVGSDDPIVAHYEIQRSEALAEWDDATGKYKLPASPDWSPWDLAPGGVSTSRAWQDTNVEYDRVYRYRYRAVSRSGVPSPWTLPSAGHIPSMVGETDLAVRSIHAQHYYEILNVLPYTYLESLDETKPVVFDFYIPSETSQILSVKLSAKGIPFRAYSTGASGGSHSHNVTIPDHHHGLDWILVERGTSVEGGHSHSISSVDGHSHSISSGGGHGHEIGTTTDGSHSHSGVSGATSSVGDHAHPISGPPGSTGGAGGHSHTISSGSTGSGGSHAHGGITAIAGTHNHGGETGSAGGHNHGGSTGTVGGHAHTILIAELFGTTGDGGGTTATTTGGTHTHSIVYGIYEDSTPNGVELYIDNGSGFPGTPQILLDNAPDGTTPYNLATELDISGYITSSGWKRIKLTSTRRGRINAQIIVKVKVSA